jgi:hypothetical protein
MFGRVTSATLLYKADKAEANAEKALEKALAFAQTTRVAAERQRILAMRIEAEEEAVRLEKEAASAKLTANRARQNLQLAIGKRNEVAAALKEAERYAEVVRLSAENFQQQLEIALAKAKTARANVSAIVEPTRAVVAETQNESVE